MAANLEFVALFVPELMRAEKYYCALFDMDVITRESPQEDGYWYALPPGKGWSDLQNAGISLGTLALRRDDFVMALFQGKPGAGQVFAIGLSMTPKEMAIVHGRLPEKDVEQYEEGNMLQFRDEYEIFWQIYSAPYRFLSTGQSSGRWLEIL